jgi:hypothetical protein
VAPRKVVRPEQPKPQQKKVWVDTRGLSKVEKKAPPSAVRPIAIDELPFQWTAQEVDHEHAGAWDWDLTPKETADLLDLLSSTSRLVWREVKELKFNSQRRTRALHHSQPVESICTEARQRLDAMGRGDQEEVFRLRHGNTIRVWGVLEGPVFSILWFDRDHQVCPTEG